MAGITPGVVVFVIDGHDGSGKTTLAQQLARSIDATYVRPFGPPFGGHLLEASQHGDFGEVLRIGDEAIRTAMSSTTSSRLVFDRFWITLFTLIPESMHQQWTLRPPTAVCWADLDTTMKRLEYRAEERYPTEWHQRYIGMYASFALRYSCELVPTSELSEAAALSRLVEWAHRGADYF